MCQLWVNLPKALKMSPPAYQEILSHDIPAVPLGAGQLRVIAGEFRGTHGPATTMSALNLWDISLGAEDSVTLQVPAGHNTMVFVRSGRVLLGEHELGPQSTVQLEPEGTDISLVALGEATQLLLLGGEPIEEPIVAQGPFVMNTREEIREANEDYNAGRMG